MIISRVAPNSAFPRLGPRQVARVLPDKDPRFVYPRSLKLVTLDFRETDQAQRDAQFNATAEQSAEQRQLYDAPASMSVFRHQRTSLLVVIRVNGSTFLGRPLYVLCYTIPFTPNGRHAHHCYAEGQITRRTMARIDWFDDEYLPDEWRSLLRSMENGIQKIIVSSRN